MRLSIIVQIFVSALFGLMAFGCDSQVDITGSDYTVEKSEVKADEDFDQMTRNFTEQLPVLLAIEESQMLDIANRIQEAIDRGENVDWQKVMIEEMGFSKSFLSQIADYNDRQISSLIEMVDQDEIESEYILYLERQQFTTKSWWGGDNDGATCGGWRPIGIITGLVGTVLSCGSCAAAPNPASCYGCAVTGTGTVAAIASFASDGCLS